MLMVAGKLVMMARISCSAIPGKQETEKGCGVGLGRSGPRMERLAKVKYPGRLRKIGWRCT